MQNVRVSFGNGEESLEVRRFRVRESLSGLFRAEVVAVSPREDLDLSIFVGGRAALSLSGTRERQLRGLCVHMAFAGVSDDGQGLATYEITLAPTLWRLTQRRGHRLFQHVTIPDIVERLLDEWQIARSWRIDRAAYPPLELRTQYGETDFDFVSRLLEEAGITFWMEDAGETDATLVLGDAPQANEPRAGSPLAFVDQVSQAYAAKAEFVTKVRLREESRPGRVTLRDHDFWRPRSTAYVHAESDRREERAHEQYLFSPGAYLQEAAGRGAPPVTDTPVADDLGVARFQEARGAELARRRVEALHADRRLLTFETSVNDLSPGVVFAIGGHPRDDISGKARFLVVSSLFEGEVAKPSEWLFAGSAVTVDHPYRPPLVTPKPRMYGLQTAVVVGASDMPGGAATALAGAVGALSSVALSEAAAAARLIDNDVYTDEHGRVRVQFPWDREGELGPGSSTWMRVSQGWAGAGYGLFTIPRVGHEVLVAFLDGDPDCPLVVGRVHNVREPAPFKLPENKTVSTWKTASSPGGDGFNELRFDDAAGREHVYVQAQKDMDQLVKHDLKEAVGNDRSTYVQGDDAEAIGGHATAFVNHNQIEATGLSRAAFVGVNRSATVGAEDSTLVGSRWSVTVARGLTRKLSKELDRVASGVGGVLRGAATGVLGPIMNDPLAKAAESALAQLGQGAFRGLHGALDLLSGFETEAGPAPTTIEVVDRQIKLTTGEASIVLDGPNVTISAQGAIALHAMEGISVLSEQELAVAGREKVAVVSATADVVVQAGKNLHLNPFEPGAAMEPAATLRGEHPDDLQRCDVCGGQLVAGPEGWFCPEDPVLQTPSE